MKNSLRDYGVAYFLFTFLTCSTAVMAADWPMWRCDAGRTASTDEELPAEVHLQWTRQYPALEPMGSGCRDLSSGKWDTTVGFETVYFPIVLGETMFVGSSVNDSVTALDVKTGEEKWKFYAEGPVRLAPAGWQGKIYVASDDGFLYCLDANDGKLLWKFRGAPMKHRVIGDERLISAWPARGGPVVADGKVYFAASIWPFMKIYIYALDAETGKKIWVNDERGAYWGKKKGELTSPQGYLVVVGDKLLVPNNRAGVSCFDRGTGKYLFDRGGRCWRACGAGERFFIDGQRHLSATVNDLETGNTVATLRRFPVLSDGLMYWMDAYNLKGIVAADTTKIEPSARKDGRGAKIPQLWTFRLKAGRDQRSAVRIKAGSRLLASSGASVVAVDIPAEGGEAKEAWSVKVEGKVEEVLAAAGRLFVVTMEGGISCFGAEKVAAKTHKTEHRGFPDAADKWTKAAGQILKAAGVTDGYALALGLGSGRLLEELVKQSDLTVIGIDPDIKKVDALRRRLDAAGLYGKRAQAIVGDPLDCGLPPYLASLIVSEDPRAAGIEKGAAFAGTMFRSLRPYGGTLCLPAAKAPVSAVKGWVESAKLEKAEVKQAGGFTLLTRVGSLPGSAPWTHHNADAGNTVSSRDDLVKAPLGLLWFGGPSGTLTINRHHHGPRPGVVDGRVIVFGYKGLTAVDVYTGRILWRADAPEIMKATEPYTTKQHGRIGANLLNSPFVSLSDGVYVAGGGTCLRLDPATGKTVSKITLPAGGDIKEFGPIRIWKDTLVAVTDPIRPIKSPTSKRVGSDYSGAGRHMIAFDRNSGKALWSRAAVQGFCNGGVALGADKVFCIDRWSAKPRGEVEGGKLMALDARTGKTIWQTGENVFGAWLAHSPEVDILLQSTGRHAYKNVYGSRAIAYQGADGKVLWDQKRGGGASIGPSMLNKSVVITQSASIMDLRTGKTVKQCKALGGKCNEHIGSARVLTRRTWGSACLDLDTNTAYSLGGFRTGCLNTHIPAEGVLNYVYAGTGCGCGLNIRASVALIHMPELAKRSSTNE